VDGDARVTAADITAAMRRIEIAQQRHGMHFMGIPMTFEKALTVGSIIAFVIQNVLRR
jgi:hypothetical protein